MKKIYTRTRLYTPIAIQWAVKKDEPEQCFVLQPLFHLNFFGVIRIQRIRIKDLMASMTFNVIKNVRYLYSSTSGWTKASCVSSYAHLSYTSLLLLKLFTTHSFLFKNTSFFFKKKKKLGIVI